MSKRLAYVDVARAFAVLCVIAGHTFSAHGLVHDFCFTFELPLFFFTSGYFTSEEKRLTNDYVRRSLQSIMLPYLVTCLILILLAAARAALFHSEVFAQNVTRWIMASLYGSGDVSERWPLMYVPSIGAIWFLPALFFVRILLVALNKLEKSWLKALSVVGIFVAGYTSVSLIWLPMSVQPAMVSLPFAYVGQLFRKYDLLNQDGRMPKWVWPLAFICFALCVRFGGHLYLNAVRFNDGILLDLLGGIAGTLSVLKLSEWLCVKSEERLRDVEFVGKSTLAVFCMHLVDLYMGLYSLALLVPDLTTNSGVKFLYRVTAAAFLCLIMWAIPALRRVYFPHAAALSIARSE